MKFLLSFFLLLFLHTQALSNYPETQQLLINKQYNEFLVRFHLEMQSGANKERNFSKLKIIEKHASLLYDLDNFSAKVIPFNDGNCLKDLKNYNLCNQSNKLKYLLTQNGPFQKIKITLSDKNILLYKSKRRTLSHNSKVNFGVAVHHITPKNTYYSFALLREIEKTKTDIILRETINFFLIKDKSSCKIAELEVRTKNDYELFVHYIKALSPLHQCTKEIIKF